jgi:cell division ATPase FtsA
MERSNSENRTIRSDATSRRAFVRGLGLAGIGLGMGLAFRPAGSQVVRARLIRNAVCKEPIVGVEFGTSKFYAAVGEQVTDSLIKILGIAEARCRVENEPVYLTSALHQLCAALYEAQEASDVMIRRVHLAVLGPRSITESNIRLLEMLGVEGGDVAFPVIPCAEAVLSSEEKDRGALMIDLGAKQTGHIAYLNGEIRDYGWHGGGGIHVTEDLAAQLQIPWARAESLKIESGDAFTGRIADADPMQKIIYLRLRAILEKTKERLISSGMRLSEMRTGIHLTGGASSQRGIVDLASEVFGLPARLARAKGFVWSDGIVESPQHSCAIGLLKLGAWRPDDDPINPIWPTGRRYFGLLPE